MSNNRKGEENMKNKLQAIWRIIWANEYFVLCPSGSTSQWYQDSTSYTAKIAKKHKENIENGLV